MIRTALGQNILDRGQALIELLVALAIGTTLIAALVSLSRSSNLGADLSRQENQASQVARETMEVLRNMRDSDLPVIYNGVGQDNALPCLPHNFDYLFNYDIGVNSDKNGVNPNPDTPDLVTQPYGKDYHLHTPQGRHCWDSNDPLYNTLVNLWHIDAFSNCDPNNFTANVLDNVVYCRYLYIADTPTSSAGGASKCNNTTSDYSTIKQFTVSVEWDSPVGHRASVLTACLKRP